MKNENKIGEIRVVVTIVTIISFLICSAISATGCSKGHNRTEEAKREALRILTSYVYVEDTEYNGVKTTTFVFTDDEYAEDFMYYWLDRGYTVSGIIWRSRTDDYTVEVIEERFDDICRETLIGLGGREEAIKAWE